MRKHQDTIFNVVLLFVIMAVTKMLFLTEPTTPVYSALQATGIPSATPTMTAQATTTGTLPYTMTPIPTSTAPATFSIVDSNGGQYLSMALDSGGIPVISYHDSITSNLKIARCENNTTCNAPTISIVDEGGPWTTSLVLDSGGIPVIGYHTYIGDLTLARCNNNTTCNTPIRTTITTFGEPSYFPSLALDSAEFPLMSLNGPSGEALYLVRCNNNTTCDTPLGYVVDNPDVGITGRYTALALDNGDIPVISYYDVSNEDLRLARCNNNTTCNAPIRTTVDSNGNVGLFTSIALDSGGIPVISYYDAGNGDLKLARCNNNTTCDAPLVTTIDSVGNVGWYISLALYSGGIPVISYLDFNNGDLKLARCNNNTTCDAPIIMVLSSIGYVGQYTSLELDNGVPVISYRDATNQDLMLYRGSAFTTVRSDLSVTQLDSPDPVLINNNLTYTITVTNNGPDTATNVTLLDTIPPGTQYVSAMPGQGSCSRNGNQVTCTLGSLNNGVSTAVTIVVLPTGLGTISNQASVTANEVDPNGSNNAMTVNTTVNAPPTPTFTPSNTPTYTPSATFTPTDTPLPSATPTPLTATPTATLTQPPAPPAYTPLPTLTPSQTLVPTNTPLPSATPTVTNTAYLLPTATATHTPLPSPPPFVP